MDEIWHRGAGSTHYERLAAAQRCQPTRPFAPGCPGTRGTREGGSRLTPLRNFQVSSGYSEHNHVSVGNQLLGAAIVSMLSRLVLLVSAFVSRAIAFHATPSRLVTPHLAPKRNARKALLPRWLPMDCDRHVAPVMSGVPPEEYERVLAAVQESGLELKGAPREVREDRKIVLEAVRQSGGALEFASTGLQADRKLVLEAVRQYGGALEFASTGLQADRKLVLEAVRQYGGALEFASAGLQVDRELVLEALQQYCGALEYPFARLQVDRELAVETVRQYGASVKFGSNPWCRTRDALRKHRELVLTWVLMDGDRRLARPNSIWYVTFMDIAGRQCCDDDKRSIYFPSLMKAALDQLSGAEADPKRYRLDQLKLWWDSFQPLPQHTIRWVKDYDASLLNCHSNALAETETAWSSENWYLLPDDQPLRERRSLPRKEKVRLGHMEAFAYIDTLSRKSTAGTPTQTEIKAIHNILFNGTMPSKAGKYRTEGVWAGEKNRVYPDPDAVPDKMADLVHYLERNEGLLHPVQLAAEAHFRLTSIHPFQEGNGRTARLLMNLLLLRAGYPIVVIHKDMREAYDDALAAGHVDSKLSKLQALIMGLCEATWIEYLSLVSDTGVTDPERAARGEGRGVAFYRAMTLASSDDAVACRVLSDVARLATKPSLRVDHDGRFNLFSLDWVDCIDLEGVYSYRQPGVPGREKNVL